MSVQIIQGDCRQAIKTLASASVDCVITDPPYGETSLEWDRWQDGWMEDIPRVLKPSGSMWVFGSQRMFLEHAAEFSGWKFAQDVIWEKHNGTGLFNDRFRRVHEHALHFYPSGRQWGAIYKKPLFTHDAVAKTVRKKARPAHWIGSTGETVYRSEDGGPKLMRSVMFARSEHGRAVHPTQKPLACLLPLIEYSCPPGGTVLDLFGGSGTTGVACRQSGRDAILIEAVPDFVEIAHTRIANDAPLFEPPQTSGG